MTQGIKNWLGIELDEVSRKEKFVSTVGGLISIVLVMLISQRVLHQTGASMLIASMGASAVLLFAVPHGPLSQPWPVIAGHTFSALIGVTCAKFLPSTLWAAALAVALSIGMMHELRCIHPPGGATALTAVIGGKSIHGLGYWFVWSPVVLNALAIVAVAITFNSLFKWRRYPASLNHSLQNNDEPSDISHEAVVAALRSLDSFVDINEDDLIRLCQMLSNEKASTRK